MTKTNLQIKHNINKELNLIFNALGRINIYMNMINDEVTTKELITEKLDETITTFDISLDDEKDTNNNL